VKEVQGNYQKINSGAPDGLEVPAPLVSPVVLIMSLTENIIQPFLCAFIRPH